MLVIVCREGVFDLHGFAIASVKASRIGILSLLVLSRQKNAVSFSMINKLLSSDRNELKYNENSNNAVRFNLLIDCRRQL